MLKQMEGSVAVAEAVALARPEVICAYPITPQTHIVEGLGELVKAGKLQNCEYINVESEFAALSVGIGSSSAGARTYTATASQGILYMAEAVYNASGMGLPIVMTVGNRAIGAPINIWNDQTDSMSMRDAGWIQLFCETNQEAVDVHIQAFKIAETLNVPVMVCMDGFILTHAYERIDMPEQAQVDQFLPPFNPRQVLDPAHPVSMGAMVGPEAFTEVRYLAHHRQLQALEVIPKIAAEYNAIVGRDNGGLISTYQTEDAETLIISLGSVIGTIKDVIDDRRAGGEKIGCVAIRSFRPFPIAAIREACSKAKRVVVLEKCFAVGLGGMVASNVRMALATQPLPVYNVIAGLGGRPITQKSLHKLFDQAAADSLEGLHFLDLNHEIIERELERERLEGCSGAVAENILRGIGAVAASKV